MLPCQIVRAGLLVISVQNRLATGTFRGEEEILRHQKVGLRAGIRSVECL